MSKKPVIAVLAVIVAALAVYYYQTPTPPPAPQEEGNMNNAAMLDTGSQTPIVTEENVEYFAGAKGYFARPEADGMYPGVGHAFANPSGMNYAPEETKDAWAKTITFLRTHLTRGVLE